MMMYHWRHNGTTMMNETSAVLTIANVKIADGGTYQCVVMVNNVSVNSSHAQLNTAHPLKPEKGELAMLQVYMINFHPYTSSTKDFIGTNRNTMMIGGGAIIIVICVFIAGMGISFKNFIYAYLFTACCCWCCRKKSKLAFETSG